MTIQLMCAFVLALVFSTGLGRVYIPWLIRKKAQQLHKAEVKQHKAKDGTPTIGGVLFISAAALVCLTLGFPAMLHGRFEHIFVLLFAAIFGAIGLIDDLKKVLKKENMGLTTHQKFALQLLAAFLFILVMRKVGFITPALYMPFSGKIFTLPSWLYYLFAMFVIVGTVNSVNITDGIDGLATGTSIPVFLFFVLLTFAWGERFQQLGLFASAMVGGLIGFLTYNFNPAKIFMGDTGSLFLGGAIAALAFSFNIPMILIPLCAMFIIETLSDIIQVGYYKATHGKRVFKMAPFHHHLEMGGWTGRMWKEKEIFILYTCISVICMAVSFLQVYDIAG
ncbi:MAG: phospho-N-acetylmuramoyl-pentapeptide-transferase [Oscillospiraceae bacterium]|nr:phospho-N-acetylmuramoyl-pentapeptide-transferase [Oscillospiraceae bacterium]